MATTSLPTTMKAYHWTKPGSPAEALTFHTEEALPVPKPHQVLVKVHSVALNPVDWKLMQGGLPEYLLPKIRTPGLDISGTIILLGSKVSTKDFKIGDSILAMLNFMESGALQEYVVVSASLIAQKPSRYNWHQAAALPLVATTVWRGLVTRGSGIQSGNRVLVNGASGGTGSVAVQVAKDLGAYVVGVCSTRNTEAVKELGADEVIDYSKTCIVDYFKTEHSDKKDVSFDIVVDCVGNGDSEIWQHKSILLKNSGRLMVIAGPSGAMKSIGGALSAGVSIGGKKLGSVFGRGPGYDVFTNSPDGKMLKDVVELLEKNQQDPLLDSVFEFGDKDQVLKAFEKSVSARAKGKIIIQVAK